MPMLWKHDRIHCLLLSLSVYSRHPIARLRFSTNKFARQKELTVPVFNKSARESDDHFDRGVNYGATSEHHKPEYYLRFWFISGFWKLTSSIGLSTRDFGKVSVEVARTRDTTWSSARKVDSSRVRRNIPARITVDTCSVKLEMKHLVPREKS